MRKKELKIPPFDHCRFFKFISIDQNGCWNFTGFKADGYGRFNIKDNIKGWISFRAHRVSYDIFNGPISHGMALDHICKSRACCNPEHLREVTYEDNVLFNSESLVALNTLKTHCPSGHEYSNENTRFTKSGGRYCLICKRTKKRLFDLRKKSCRLN